jgi:hypothetical protein
VWPDAREGRTEHRRFVAVRLHNDGPGVALDVRWSLMFWRAEDGAEDRRHSELLQRQLVSTPIRGLRPGQASADQEVTIPSERVGHTWFAVVRYADSAGQHWQYVEPLNRAELAHPAERLRPPPQTPPEQTLPNW